MEQKAGMIRFRTADHHTVYLRNLYRNACAFFIGGGPSLLELDLDRLRRPGVVTFGVNNAATVFRPHIWTCMDAAQRFPRCVWLDSTILKLVPTSRREERIAGGTAERVRDCPNVLFFRRNLDPIDYGSDELAASETSKHVSMSDVAGVSLLAHFRPPLKIPP